MKINFKFLIMLLVAALAILFLNITTVNASELKTIKFKDKGLYEKIVSYYYGNIEYEDYDNLTIKLSQQQIESMTILVVSREYNITDLSGIENFTNLKHLYMNGQNISDITVLGKLTNLDTLELNENKIINIDALSNLKYLTCLGLSNNQISDINALENLSWLKRLNLDNNQINDIEVFNQKKLDGLRELFLSENQMNNDNIKPIKNLPSITRLDLSKNQITDFSELTNIRTIRELCLDYNDIKDASSLSNMYLTELSINYNKNLNLDTLENIDANKLYCKQSVDINIIMPKGSKKEFDFPVFYKKALDKNSNLNINDDINWNICTESDQIEIDMERQKIIVNVPTDYEYNKMKISTYTVQDETGYNARITRWNS